MRAVKLFGHSVRQVVGNLWVALRISVLPMGLAAALTGHFVKPALEPLNALLQAGNTGFPLLAGFFVAVSLIALVWLVAMLWIAVAWHRYILQSEQPFGLRPRWHGEEMLAYCRYVFQIAVIGMVAAIPFFSAVMIFGAYRSQGISSLTALISVAGLFFFGWLFCRLSPLLPAAALDEPMTAREAWTATAEQNCTFVLLFLMMTLLIVTLDLVEEFIEQTRFYILATIWPMVRIWFSTMLGISILTTIYSHYVEKRPLIGD